VENVRVLATLGPIEAWVVLYCSWEVLKLGHFLAGILCLRTFFIWDVLRLVGFVLGRFVEVHNNRPFIFNTNLIFCVHCPNIKSLE
jgi:hypothetical protein